MRVLTALDEGYVDFAAEEVGNSIGTILENPLLPLWSLSTF